MKKYLACLLTTAMLLGLSACGVKGPLYFPAEKPAETQSINQG
ncbi:LPS translocon maturation chaperone LptM [Testudinibacter sp. P80/BLE/0925]